jgi:hypothetical protein
MVAIAVLNCKNDAITSGYRPGGPENSFLPAFFVKNAYLSAQRTPHQATPDRAVHIT